MVVGRLLSYWEGNFSEAMLNFGRVCFSPLRNDTKEICNQLTKCCSCNEACNTCPPADQSGCTNMRTLEYFAINYLNYLFTCAGVVWSISLKLTGKSRHSFLVFEMIRSIPSCQPSFFGRLTTDCIDLMNKSFTFCTAVVWEDCAPHIWAHPRDFGQSKAVSLELTFSSILGSLVVSTHWKIRANKKSWLSPSATKKSWR